MIDLSAIPEELLIARGQLSTVNSRARTLRLDIRDRMHAITEHARTVVRLMDDSQVTPEENLEHMNASLSVALMAWDELKGLNEQIETLKPAAWPKGK